jgi:hypothetical protein
MLPHFEQIWISPMVAASQTLSRCRHVVQVMVKSSTICRLALDLFSATRLTVILRPKTQEEYNPPAGSQKMAIKPTGAKLAGLSRALHDLRWEGKIHSRRCDRTTKSFR